MGATTALVDVFKQLPDHRDPRGVRHPLHAILALVAVAVMAGARGWSQIARFGRHRELAFAKLLGFTRRPPGKSTLYYALRDADGEHIERLTRDWLAAQLDEPDLLSIDGKTLCGSACDDMAGLHVLNIFSTTHRTIVAQLAVDAKTNEHKAALQALGIIDVSGKTIVADAMFTQRDLAAEITAQSGDYVMQVKDNQPGLKREIAELFDADRDALSPS